MKKIDFFENWYKQHMNYVIRPYAERILNTELPEAFSKKNVVVLAACPNAGKTLMSIAWMEKYLIDNPTHRILVLTHGQTLLRNQFCRDIKKSKVGFTYEKIKSGEDFRHAVKQVTISLPHTIINTIDDDDNIFNVIVIDEAHHYYNAEDGMVQRIIDKYKFEKQLLLTGTPAPFIAKKMDIIAVSLEELFEGGWAADPFVVVSKSSYPLTKNDYNKQDELKKNVELNAKETIETLNSLLNIIEKKILKSGWLNSIETLGKTLIVTKNIQQGKDVKKYYAELGVEALLSTSDNDKESKNIKKFINSDINILIVVDRGILGFNLPILVNIIDMKFGKNVSNLFQLFNRITRLHPNNNQKYFFKVVPDTMEQEFLYILSAAISLMLKSNYIKYNGTTKDIVIPVVKKKIKQEDAGNKKVRKNGFAYKFEPITYIDVPVFKMWKKYNDTFSWNTLGEIRDSISDFRSWSNYSNEENYQYCIQTIKNYYNLMK